MLFVELSSSPSSTCTHTDDVNARRACALLRGWTVTGLCACALPQVAHDQRVRALTVWNWIKDSSKPKHRMQNRLLWFPKGHFHIIAMHRVDLQFACFCDHAYVTMRWWKDDFPHSWSTHDTSNWREAPPAGRHQETARGLLRHMRKLNQLTQASDKLRQESWWLAACYSHGACRTLSYRPLPGHKSSDPFRWFWSGNFFVRFRK